MNLYGYTANDPVNATDPTGLEKYNFTIKALGGLIGGVKLSYSISFDTENFQLTESLKIGGGLVEGGFVGADGSVSPSSDTPTPAINETKTNVALTTTVNAGFGPSASKSAKANIITVSDRAPAKGPDFKVNDTKFGVGAGLAASQTLDVTLTKSSTIVRDVLGAFGVQSEADKAQEAAAAELKEEEKR